MNQVKPAAMGFGQPVAQQLPTMKQVPQKIMLEEEDMGEDFGEDDYGYDEED